MISEQESRIPQAGQGAGTGLLNLTLSLAVYMPFMSVVLRREALESIKSRLVLT
jgi:hypothetical protein